MQYVLYVRIDEQWVETDRFHATDNVDAFRKSLQLLDPGHRGCPIAFAPVERAHPASTGNEGAARAC
jgi:hypothetical protein